MVWKGVKLVHGVSEDDESGYNKFRVLLVVGNTNTNEHGLRKTPRSFVEVVYLQRFGSWWKVHKSVPTYLKPPKRR